MGALAPAIPWIPKDDLLLKNAIEAGASLESLAKGAVEFSRRFTIKELQDRWYALLYDPVTSAEASSQLVVFERSSKSAKADNSKVSHGKRKAESVRRSYYAMRKRICNEALDQNDINFLIAPNESCFITATEGPGSNNMLVDQMPTHYGIEGANFNDLHRVFPDVIDSAARCDAEGPTREQNVLCTESTQMAGSNMAMEGNGCAHGQTGSCEEVPDQNIYQANGLEANLAISECETSLHHLQYASSPPAMPDWKNIESISVPVMPDDGASRENNMQSELTNHISHAGLKNSNACTESYLAELSNSLFDFTSDDDMLIIDGGKDVIAKTYLDGLSSLLLNSPDDLNDGTLELGESAVVDEYHDVPFIVGLEVKNNAGEIDVEHNSEFQMPMFAATVNSEFSEICNSVIFCTLNTEDPEIPSNDHLSFSGKQRQSSALRRTQSEANKPSFSCNDSTGIQKRINHASLVREPNPVLRPTDTGTSLLVDELGVKFETSRGERHNSLSNRSTSQGGLSQSSLTVKDGSSKLPLEKSGQVVAMSQARTGCDGISQEGHTLSNTLNQEFCSLESANPLAVEHDEEPLFFEDDQLYESDSDIPHFSDIESMILDMDLIPEDQDSLCSSEVAKYQHEDAKRVIIRLEQNAESCMRRATTSRRAFAIMYGRHSKHYIKKPEVLIGRGTDDVPVDIDLGREGRANKISRRQAIIKMEEDGTFTLRNMGKNSIYVNSTEVSNGHILGLNSNCIIEGPAIAAGTTYLAQGFNIRGMPFIFEINCALVKKYLQRAPKKVNAKRPEV